MQPPPAANTSLGYVVPDMGWKKKDLKEAAQEQKRQKLQAGLQAYYEGRKAGEERDALVEYMVGRRWSDETLAEPYARPDSGQSLPGASHSPGGIPMSPSTPSPDWLPRGYPHPADLPGIPLALEYGGEIDIPHPSSVIGMRLAQWGATFSATLSAPAGGEAAAGEIIEGDPVGQPLRKPTIEIGPFFYSPSQNAFGGVDHEFGMRFGTQRVSAPNGAEVEFRRSVNIEWKGLGRGAWNRVIKVEYNYLDYTASSTVPELPASAASAGVYFEIAPAPTAVVAIAAIIAAITAVTVSPIPVLP